MALAADGVDQQNDGAMEKQESYGANQRFSSYY